MVNNLINKLGNYQDFSIEGNIEKFEEVLSELASTKNPEIIPGLLAFFDDGCDFPEVMFSIIHTIEIFDDAKYVEKLLVTLPEVWKRSPYWVKVIHFRILNSKDTMDEYAKQVRKINDELKEIVREVISKIGTDSPKFKERCDFILSQI